MKTAQAFVSDFASGDWDAQWSLLSPLARAGWPSQAARDAMLTQKFKAYPAASVTLGTPKANQTWVDRENLAQVGGLWSVEASVTLRGPAPPVPGGLTSTYASQPLYLSAAPGGAASVVGEGPASYDAPLLPHAPVPAARAVVPVLMYHRVAPYPQRSLYSSQYAYNIDYGLTVSPQEFDAQVDYLAARGYHAVSLTRLYDWLLYGLELPSKPVVFTFDDGRASPLQYAVPTLVAHGFTAEFFVPTGLLGWNNQAQHYLTGAQVGELAAQGFWVEDHTLKDNVALWSLSPAQLAPIVEASRQRLESLTGTDVQFIAYTGVWPYPQAASAGPAEHQLFSYLGAIGYVGGVVDARIDSSQVLASEPWQLPRIRVNPEESIATFAALLTSG